ncbi:MmpS family transport accessory protein [Streptomyces sp. NPDC020379]|uniref:MmpS family transport accessory protein n=1 Tax=Streptomyces sp. NPDC020379 TaxID=3365071 RepID=UPI00379D52C3
MQRTLRNTLAALAVTGSALALAACGAAEEKVTESVDKAVKETYEVTYEITGSGTATVDFNAGKGTANEPQLETETDAALPWKKTVTLKGIAAPTVQAGGAADGAEVTCRITHKGKVLKSETSKDASAPASCVAVSPLA